MVRDFLSSLNICMAHSSIVSTEITEICTKFKTHATDKTIELYEMLPGELFTCLWQI